MAARWARRDRRRSRDRQPGDTRARQPRRLSGSGLRRPGRAALGSGRSRRDLRPDAGRDRRPFRPRRARGRRLSDAGPARGDGRGRGAAARRVRIDGGMAANEWLCQFLADMLQLPVERPRNLETTALGAAFLAGLATGVWADLDAIAATWQRRDQFTPALSADRRDELVAGWRTAVARTLSHR